MEAKKKYNILLVSDCFYPQLGGIEVHIFQLAICLIERGHKVVMLTHAFDEREGIRYLTHGLKVYYVPWTPLVEKRVLPTIFFMVPLFRHILIREQIDIVHGHTSASAMALELLVHAKSLGRKTVFTEHSVFDVSSVANIHNNKIIKIAGSYDAAIAVSNACKESMCIRTAIDPNIIYTIPNAIDASNFTPDPSKRYPKDTINIVCVSRLTYRKGSDLLVDVIPYICRKYPKVHFIIGGDGPKKQVIENMVKREELNDRVELLGQINHKDVRGVLVRGHIFLNTSLTEAFCIAILEAASTGLLVVSTDVGGVREVLPSHYVHLAQPNPDDIIQKLEIAIKNYKNVNPLQMHEDVKKLYNWRDIAKRTERVYDFVMTKPKEPMHQMFKFYFSGGNVARYVTILIWALMMIWITFLEIITPEKKIEKAVGFPYQLYSQNPKKYGEHDFSVLRKEKKEDI